MARDRASRLAGWTTGLVLLCATTPVPASAQWPPDSIVNLRVLSKDLPFDSLVGIMAGFTRALGVRCSTCHVGEESQQLAEYDFASDEKAMKRTARTMLEMVAAINGRHLDSLASRLEPPVRVECFTCHRGARAPRKLQDVLVAAWDAGGVDSVIAAYHGLRERNYGRAVFSFDDVALADVSTVLEARGRIEDAARVDSLNVDMNPTSAFARRLHVQRALLVAYMRSDTTGGRLFDRLAAEYGPGPFAEPLLRQLGTTLTRRGMRTAAIDVLQRNVERFPESPGAHAALAEAFAAAGDIAQAIRHYERVLVLSPDNANAAERLRELRRQGESGR
jgi:tetratricopeptide (TPR) repeat protein